MPVLLDLGLDLLEIETSHRCKLLNLIAVASLQEADVRDRIDLVVVRQLTALVNIDLQEGHLLSLACDCWELLLEPLARRAPNG